MELAEYTSAHRTRQHGHENGYVKKTGKRTQKWEGFYHIYRKQAGGTEKREKRSKILGPVAKMTKGEAEEALRVFIRRFHEQPAAESSENTVSVLCDDARELKLSGWEEDTQSTTTSIFNLIKAHLGDRLIGDVRPEDLDKLFNKLAQIRRVTRKGKVTIGYGESTFKKVLIYLRLTFDLAIERGLIRKNPARSVIVKLKVPKVVRSREVDRLIEQGGKPVLLPHELQRLLAVMDERDRLIVWTLAIGATRPNELFAIFGRDVGTNWIRIDKALNRRLKTKGTKNSMPRYIYIPPFLGRNFEHWMQEQNIGRNSLVFTSRFDGPISRQVFLRDRLRPAAERAGIAKSVDSRMLRRSFATLANALDLDTKAIQMQMGHKNPDMSRKEYMQPVDPKRAADMDRFSQMLLGEIPLPFDFTEKIGSSGAVN